jgi:glycosyltransferase involved in cell wall biosynthesis
MSKPIVSVVVTTFNSSEFLEECLESISSQGYKSIELIVVDNNSKDNTRLIAQKFTEKVYIFGPERSAQRNFGVEKSRGEFVLIIDSDMVLGSHVIEEIAINFQAKHEAMCLVVPEESYGIGFWAKCKKLERSFYLGVEWMEAARAFRRVVFLEVGGYDEKNTGTEDYDLPHRIEFKYNSKSVDRINGVIYHNEGIFSLVRSCKKKFYYARALDVYSNKVENKKYFSKQSSVLSRFGLYFKSPRKLFINPILGFGMLFMKCCEISSGAAGYALRSFDSNMVDKIYKK